MLVERKQTCCEDFRKISIEFVKPWEVLPLGALSFSSALGPHRGPRPRPRPHCCPCSPSCSCPSPPPPPPLHFDSCTVNWRSSSNISWS